MATLNKRGDTWHATAYAHGGKRVRLSMRTADRTVAVSKAAAWERKLAAVPDPVPLSAVLDAAHTAQQLHRRAPATLRRAASSTAKGLGFRPGKRAGSARTAGVPTGRRPRSPRG